MVGLEERWLSTWILFEKFGHCHAWLDRCSCAHKTQRYTISSEKQKWPRGGLAGVVLQLASVPWDRAEDNSWREK
jgi:hypothetical protein